MEKGWTWGRVPMKIGRGGGVRSVNEWGFVFFVEKKKREVGSRRQGNKKMRERGE